MNPKQIWGNLAVTDLARTTKFYTALGFKSNNKHISEELTSFYFGNDNLVLHFFLKDILQNNMQVEVADAQKVTEILFTLSAESRQEVDDWQKEVESAGGKIISAAQEFGKGYYGFLFSDPDGHKFNVFYM